MAEIVLCEPSQLYNLLNQRLCVSRLAEINFLCLVDARETQDYNTSHVVSAVNARAVSENTFVLPEALEVDSMHHVVVYDNNSSCLQEQGRALDCAQTLAKTRIHPVHVVRGGFQKFSALYPFLRTEKTLYTITELENLKAYPVEIIPGLLFMGDQQQSFDLDVLRDLKISAVVSISQSDGPESRSITGNQTILNIPAADTVTSDLYSSFERICSFIGSHINLDSRVLIVSRQGRSRCSATAVAFLMHHLRYSLEEAWKSVLSFKPTMRPNSGFVQQLSDWELHIMGAKLTDISGLQL